MTYLSSLFSILTIESSFINVDHYKFSLGGLTNINSIKLQERAIHNQGKLGEMIFPPLLISQTSFGCSIRHFLNIAHDNYNI